MESHPSQSSRAPLAARGTDAAVLVACGLAFLATQLAFPDSLNYSHLVLVLPAMIAAGGLVVCGWMAWQGIPGGGLIAGFFSLCVATFWIGQARQEYGKHPDTLTLSTMGDSVRGAELFVNGVDLGPSPVKISKADFESRVPQWDKPPAVIDEKVYIPVRGPQPESCWQRDYKRWYSWDYPKVKSGILYYQAKYGGEFGAAPGSAGGGEGGANIEFIFPQRDQRLELLLNQARLADYHVSTEWFSAIQTFDEDGWVALREAARSEPGMDDVLSQWARSKYHLDTVSDAGDAWNALEQVCRESDAAGVYLTPSVAGRAVEILARQVDPDQLVRACSGVIARTSGATFAMWPMARHMQYGTADTSDKLNYLGGNRDGSSSDEQGQFYGTSGGAGSSLRPSDLVIAHALAEMWKAGIAHEKIQSEIGPDLLAWHYNGGLTLPLVFAADIGGPVVDAFLLAQPWQREINGGNPGVGVFEAGGNEINRWLYLLACLDDDAGRAFRREHAAEILDMASKLTGGIMFVWDNKLDFLLQDRELAWKFWPRFRELVGKKQSSPDEVARMEYTYLEKMNAPASAFIDLWKEEQPQSQTADQAFGVLHFNTPQDQAAPIAAGLLDFFQRDPHAMDQIADPNNRQYLMGVLKNIVDPNGQFIADMRKYAPQETPVTGSFAHDWRSRASIWLSGPAGLSPLVAQLANAPEPSLRLLSLSAIRGVPVSANRQLLQKLLSDPDPIVQHEARGLDAELKSLAAQSPDALTSAGPATTRP
jgi:hypothetical protein